MSEILLAIGALAVILFLFVVPFLNWIETGRWEFFPWQ